MAMSKTQAVRAAYRADPSRSTEVLIDIAGQRLGIPPSQRREELLHVVYNVRSIERRRAHLQQNPPQEAGDIAPKGFFNRRLSPAGRFCREWMLLHVEDDSADVDTCLQAAAQAGHDASEWMARSAYDWAIDMLDEAKKARTPGGQPYLEALEERITPPEPATPDETTPQPASSQELMTLMLPDVSMALGINRALAAQDIIDPARLPMERKLELISEIGQRLPSLHKNASDLCGSQLRLLRELVGTALIHYSAIYNYASGMSFEDLLRESQLREQRQRDTAELQSA